MVAAFGLSRLESRLEKSTDTVSAADVAAMLKNVLEKTKEAGPPESSNPLPHRAAGFPPPLALPARDTSLDVSNYVLPHSAPSWESPSGLAGEPELPGPTHPPRRANPQFRQTRHANRV